MFSARKSYGVTTHLPMQPSSNTSFAAPYPVPSVSARTPTDSTLPTPQRTARPPKTNGVAINAPAVYSVPLASSPVSDGLNVSS